MTDIYSLLMEPDKAGTAVLDEPAVESVLPEPEKPLDVYEVLEQEETARQWDTFAAQAQVQRESVETPGFFEKLTAGLSKGWEVYNPRMIGNVMQLLGRKLQEPVGVSGEFRVLKPKWTRDFGKWMASTGAQAVKGTEVVREEMEKDLSPEMLDSWLYEGAATAVQSLSVSSPMAIIGVTSGLGTVGISVLSSLTTGGIYGYAEVNEYLNEYAAAKGVSREQAEHDVAWSALASGVTEAGFEAAGQFIPMAAIFKAARGPAKNVARYVGKLMFAMLVVEPFSEMTTEAATALVQTGIRKADGMPTQGYMEAATGVLGPTWFASLLMGGGHAAVAHLPHAARRLSILKKHFPDLAEKFGAKKHLLTAYDQARDLVKGDPATAIAVATGSPSRAAFRDAGITANISITEREDLQKFIRKALDIIEQRQPPAPEPRTRLPITKSVLLSPEMKARIAEEERVKKAAEPTPPPAEEEAEPPIKPTEKPEPVPEPPLEPAKPVPQPIPEPTPEQVPEPGAVPDVSKGEQRFQPDLSVVLVPPKIIKIDPGGLQFKSEVNERGVQVDKQGKEVELKGPWDPNVAGIMFLWESKEGDIFVVNGHNRLGKALKEGVDLVRAQIVREIDGVTAEDARMMGAHINIMQGRGTLFDHTEYWRNQDEKTLEKSVKDFPGNPRATRGFIIGQGASDNTYALWRNEKLSDEQAAYISAAAPKDAAKQAVALDYIKDFPDATKNDIIRYLKQLDAVKDAKKSKQGSLFGDDLDLEKDRAKQRIMAAAAGKRIRELQDEKRLLKSAGKIAVHKKAAELGIKIEVAEGAEALIQKIDEQIEEFERYWLHPERMAVVKELAFGLDTGLFKGSGETMLEEEKAPPKIGLKKPAAKPAILGKKLEQPREKPVKIGKKPPAKLGKKPGLEGVEKALPGAGALDVPVTMEPSVEQISAHDILKTMEKDFGVPIRFRKIGSTKSAGFYKPKAQVVRHAKGYEGNIAVGAHEISHHIDFTLFHSNKLPLPLCKELKTLDYDELKARTREGFAEFMRMYLTGIPVEDQAPKFYKYFTETWLPDHPDIQRKLAKLEALISKWRMQGALGRVASNISKTGKPAKPIDVSVQAQVRDFFNATRDKIYFEMKDEGHYLNLFQKAAVKKGARLLPGAGPYDVWKALTQSGGAYARRAIYSGVFRITGKMERFGPSISDALSQIKPEENDLFSQWVYARHARESWAKGKHPGISLEDANYVYEKHGSKRFERAAVTLKAFNDGLILMLADAGVISKDTADIIINYYQTYVPLMRVRESKWRLFAKKIMGRKIGDLGSPVKRRGGADLQIIDPIQATMERAVRFYSRAAQQQVQNAMVRVAKKVKGMGVWMEKIPPGMKRTGFTLAEILPQLDEMGVDIDAMFEGAEINPEEIINIYRPDYFSTGDKPIVRFLRKGEPELYWLDKNLYRAVTSMDYFTLPWFLDMTIGKLSRLYKLGAVGLSPTFGFVTNPLRDIQTYYFQSEKLTKDDFWLPVLALKFAKSEILGKEDNPVIQIWKEAGGEMSTFFGLDRKDLQRVAEDVAADPKKRQRLKIVKDPINALQRGLSITEGTLRVAEMMKVFKRYGYTETDLRNLIATGQRPKRRIIFEALNAANDVTVNFKRLGRTGKWINRMVPFFNPNLEGIDKFSRTWRDSPSMTAYRVAIAAIPLVLVYWWFRKDDDDYKEQPAWLKYGYWTVEDDTGATVVRIPRSHEWGLALSGIEMFLNAMYAKDPKALEQWAEHAANTIPPATRIPGVTPLMEIFYNYDGFRESPIITPAIAGREPKDQYTSYNTEFSKLVGKALNLSPAKIDHFFQGTFPRIYRGGMKGAEALITTGELETADIPVLAGVTLRGEYSRSTDDFYKSRTDITQKYGSAKMRGEVPAEVRVEYKKYNDLSKLMSNIRKLRIDVKKRAERFEYTKWIIGLARMGLGEESLSRYPHLFVAEEEMPDSVRVIRDEYLKNTLYQLSASAPKIGKSKKEYAVRQSYLAWLFKNVGLEPSELRALFRAEALKDRNMKRSGDAYQKRYRLLKSRLAKINP